MEKNKQKRFFSLKNDYAFTQIMKKEKVLQGFLSAVLGISVEDIISIEVKDRYLDRTSKEEKYGILDVRVKVTSIGDFGIEMQLNEFTYWENRSIFYTSKMYIEDVLGGVGYEQCKKVINISVLGFNLCKDTKYFHSSFHLREDKRGSIYSDILEFHIIEVKADIRNPLRYLLITSLPLRGISAGACTPAETGKSNPHLRSGGLPR